LLPKADVSADVASRPLWANRRHPSFRGLSTTSTLGPLRRPRRIARPEGTIMKLPRRRILHLAAGAAALATLPGRARAQQYPARPVTMVVPFAAGGPTDTLARILATHMKESLPNRDH